MVIKVFYAVIIVFSAAMVFLLAQEPYFNDEIRRDFNFSSVTLTNVTSYEIDFNKTGAVYNALKVKRFDDRDEFNGFKASVIRDNLRHLLSSENAVRKGDQLKFIDSVVYENNQSTILKSDLLIYDIKKRFGNVPGNFVLDYKQEKMTGYNLQYDLNSTKLQAQGVSVWLKR